eukprot:g8523.t1
MGPLQENFERFLAVRKREIAARVSRKYSKGRSAEEKQALRELFVSTVLGYVGCPYSHRPHPEDSPLRALPALDCCGLIR